MSAKEVSIGYVIVNAETRDLNWDGELHRTEESAIGSLTEPQLLYCRSLEEENEDKIYWGKHYQISPVYLEPLRRVLDLGAVKEGGKTRITVPCQATGRMRITAPITHLCPFVDEVDNGTITLEWTTFGQTFELHGLRSYLQSFAGDKISHEDLSEAIQGELSAYPGIRDVTVRTAWRTAGMEVQCFSSPTPADQP